MAEANGEKEVEETLSPVVQRKILISAAGVIAGVAILLAIFIALHAPRYAADSTLAYTKTIAGMASSSELPTGNGGAVTVASRALGDQQMARLIDQNDLYPTERQRQPTTALIGRLRKELTLSEPASGTLRVTVRTSDQEKALAVANGVAALLGQFEVVVNVPGPPPPADARLKKGRHHPVVYPSVVVPTVMLPPSGNGQNFAELTHQVDRVEDTLQNLVLSKAELEAEQHQVDTKMTTLEKTERKAAAVGRTVAQTEEIQDQRIEIEQQLAAKRAKLAGLRERYTEEYPDVQREEGDIAVLEARMAALPARNGSAGSAPAPNEEQQAAMEKLRQEKQRVDHDLERNEISVAAEEQRKGDLLAQIDRMRTNPGRPVIAQHPSPATPSATLATSSSNAAFVGQAPQMISVPFFPFRVTESAVEATQVTTSRLALSIWLILGTVVLLALCFVPMVPAHYAAVVTSAEDLQQGMPEHVIYLGDVGRES